jgi:hypothetical protein
MTEDKSISGYAPRKAALRAQVARASHEALTIFAADKISKVRELTLENPTRRQPARAPVARDLRLAHYRHSLRMLDEHLYDSLLVKRCVPSSRRSPRLRATRPAASPFYNVSRVSQ